jgi:hypothetical protein
MLRDYCTGKVPRRTYTGEATVSSQAIATKIQQPM